MGRFCCIDRIVHPRLFQLGYVAIPSSGVFTAIAILGGLLVARSTAHRLSLDSERVWDAGVAGVLTALLAPRLILIFTHWADFRDHPVWMLGLVSVRSPFAIAAGLAVAIAISGLFIYFAALPLRRTLDAFAPGLTLGWAVYWVGAYLAGSPFGTPTSLPWAVTYTSRLASIWSHTPLGTPLHPVQLYFALIALALFALSVWLLRTAATSRIRDGEVMGACLFLFGLSTFFLDFLRGDFRSGTLLVAEVHATAMVVAGGLLWLL